MPIRLRFVQRDAQYKVLAAFDGVAAPREGERIEIDGAPYLVENVLWKVDRGTMTASVTVATGLSGI